MPQTMRLVGKGGVCASEDEAGGEGRSVCGST